MFRFLPVALVAACAPTARPTESALEVWLDNWVEARACLVANADDTRTGIEMNSLLGRECGELLARLDRQIGDDQHPIDQMWREMVAQVRRIATDEKLDSRARAVDRIEYLALSSGIAIDHPIPPRPRGMVLEALPAPWEPFDRGQGEKRFNGSPVDWVGLDRYMVVEKLGTTSVVKHSSSEILALPSYDVTVPNDAWFATAIGDNQLVVRRPGDDEYCAYVVESTHDGGRHWKRELMFPGGNYDWGWQDTRSGEIVVQADQHGVRYVQQLTAAGPGPWRQTATPDLLWPAFCVSDGSFWVSHGDLLISVKTGSRISLTGWANRPDLACRGATATVLRHDPEVIERCDTKCERIFALPFKTGDEPWTRRGVVGVLDDGRWIYALRTSGMIAVWVEGVSLPTFWKRPTFGELGWAQAIAVVAGQPALVVQTVTNRRYFVPLPIK